ncbi:MAG TPA: hypothetical protein PK967_19700, partial [Candidatus Hydrogenedentes bacterium]|nr:hypothetical protein [Candidatus Hydrogenedentota bacterium]
MMQGRKIWVGGAMSAAVVLAAMAAMTGLFTLQTASAQSLALVAKADGSYIRGVVTNELTGNPIAGVKVELA